MTSASKRRRGTRPSAPVQGPSADISISIRDEIEERIRRFSEANTGYRTPVPGLRIARVTAPVPPTLHIDRPCMCMCIRGQRRVSVGETVVFHDENQLVLTAIDRPTVFAIPHASSQKPYTALSIDIDLDLARQMMAHIDVKECNVAPTPSGLTAEVTPELLDCVLRLTRLIERPSEIAVLADLIHREILYRVLSGPAGGSLRQIALLGSQGQRVSKVVAWLREHFRGPLRINQLAKMAGMGVSTLHRHFHELTDMSPIQYQKRLRLHEARRLMLEESYEVGTAALDVGYESSTQFIREYRRLFGEAPLRNIKALRTTALSSAAI
jgi:AraC-like DNA-binding protein